MPKIDTITTPKCQIIYAWLKEADVKYNADGTYHSTNILDPKIPEHKAFMAKIEEYLDASKGYAEEILSGQGGKGIAKLKKLARVSPLVAEVDEQGEETGRFLFKVKQNKKYKYFDKKLGKDVDVVIEGISHWDTAGKAIANPPSTRRGSVLQFRSPVTSYYSEKDVAYGITFKINAVRVVELAEFQATCPEGFEMDGEGYNLGAGDSFYSTPADNGSGSDSNGDF